MYQNHDHMLYCSWDMASDECNYLLFWAFICPFTPPPPLTVEKIKIYEKWKSCQEISQFYRCVSKITIRWLQICLVHASHPPVLKTNNHWYLKGGQAQFCLCCTYSPNVNQLWKPWSGDNTLKVIYRSM